MMAAGSGEGTIDVFWSFRSPYCYLALDRLIAIDSTFEIEVAIRPVYPIAVRKPDFFRKVDPRYRRNHLHDSARMAEYLGIPYRRPVPDPIVQDMETHEIAAEQPYIRRVTRLAAAAQLDGKALAYCDQVMRLLWDGSTDDWHEGDKITRAMERAGLDGPALEAAVAADPERYDTVIEKNQAAHAEADHWGVPTMVFRGETFFGQDRIDVLAWRLRREGVAEAGPS